MFATFVKFRFLCNKSNVSARCGRTIPTDFAKG